MLFKPFVARALLALALHAGLTVAMAADIKAPDVLIREVSIEVIDALNSGRRRMPSCA